MQMATLYRRNVGFLKRQVVRGKNVSDLTNGQYGGMESGSFGRGKARGS